MEENIKRVEKLVHATNSALAQMKFSLMFDDVNGGRNGRTVRPEGLDRMLVDKYLNGDDLKQCQKEFQLEANKMLAKVEEMFGSNEPDRKNSKAIDRIKEINKEINSIKLEQSKPEETEQSRRKLFSLINEEKFSPDITLSKRSVGNKPSISFNREKESLEKAYVAPSKNGSHFSVMKSPNKSKLELKNKILETQEIVDRGFLTAKHLAQKVDWITKWDKKEKTPSTDKTVSESNLTNLEKKTESNDTIKTVKCRRHSEKEEKRERIVQEIEKINTQVIDVKRKELQRRVNSNLQLQRLPSVHIRGGLKLQRVHNLEIPANEDTTCERLNTAISFLSHEQVEKEKMEKIIEKIRRENCYCIEDSIRRNYIECFNCGKLNKIRNAWADPREIDKILHQCNFNVFDPRIDEFAEKFGTVGVKNYFEKSQTPKTLRSDIFIPEEPKVKSKNVSEEIETKHQSEQLKKSSRRFTLREFSNQIFKKYKQEIETLEDNHLKLESILQNLFSKVDESRKLFEDCHYLKNLKIGSEKISNLTSAKPNVVSLSGRSFKNRKKQKQLKKKDLNKTKSQAESPKIKTRGKKILYPIPSFDKLLQAKNTKEGILPSAHLNKSGNVNPSATELQGKFMTASLAKQTRNTEHLEKKEEAEEKLSSVTSASASKSQNINQLETPIEKRNSEKAVVMASIQKKTAKSEDGISREEEMPNRSFSSKSRMTKLSVTKKEKLEEEKISVVATSVFPNKSSETCREDLSLAQSKTVKSVFRKKDVKIESLVTSPGNKINSETEETTSEKSENVYESDFESFTNELEEKVNEREEEEELELIPRLKKLSTISEVDSELEKKLSDEQKVTKRTNFDIDDSRKFFEMGTYNGMQQEEKVGLFKQKEDNSFNSEISSKSKKASEASSKSTPTELATSLKDILLALQDQFAKTESLAEKLTENVKIKREEKAEPDIPSMMLGTWKMGAPGKIVENLQSARKNWDCTPKLSPSLILPEKIASEGSEKSEKDLFADSLYDDGGSSLGEIILSDRKRINSAKSENSSISEPGNHFLNSDGGA